MNDFIFGKKNIKCHGFLKGEISRLRNEKRELEIENRKLELEIEKLERYIETLKRKFSGPTFNPYT